MNTLIVTRYHLARIFHYVNLNELMDEIIEELTRSLREFDELRTEVRRRDGFMHLRPRPGILEWMPIMEGQSAVLIKVVGYNPFNPTDHSLPTIVSTMSLYDVCTGHLVALMDGILPTALRTGAASAVASRILASPESKVLGLIGCGAQALTQLHALARVFEFDEVLIYDTDAAAQHSFLKRSEFLRLNVRKARRDVLERESDIICTATSVEIDGGPVLDDSELKGWAHVNAIGSDFPGKKELPLSLLRRSLVCPDFPPQAMIEGECQQLVEGEVGPSLAALVKNPEAYEQYRYGLTVFDSTGYALEDQVVMNVLLRHAGQLNLGVELPVETTTTDPQNPYQIIDHLVLPHLSNSEAGDLELLPQTVGSFGPGEPS
jgi:ornithine cyclodeaminase/alanine dehydrogenase-like protein (mu-crystallin family)